MSKKEEISYKSKLPKIKNVFTYPYFCISKIIAIISFGLGAVLLAIFVFPFTSVAGFASNTTFLL